MQPLFPPDSFPAAGSQLPAGKLWRDLDPKQSEHIAGGYWAYHMAARPSVRPHSQSADYRYGYYGLST